MWKDHLEQKLPHFLRAVTSELEAKLQPPSLIRLAGGLPASEVLPHSLIREWFESSLRESPTESLQYGSAMGIEKLRQQVSYMNGISTDNLIISSGSQSILNGLGQLLLGPGSRVGFTAPSYMGMLRAWLPLGVDFIPVNSQYGRLDLNRVEIEMRRGLDVLYLIPHHDNPTGVTLNCYERKCIVELADKFGCFLVEDDAYRELGFVESPFKSLYELAPHMTIHVRTFAKTLAPGLRVGWASAPRDIIEGLEQVRLATDFHPSTVSQMIVCNALQSGYIDDHLQTIRKLYAHRSRALESALCQELGEIAEWKSPTGGFFYLVTLRGIDDTDELLERAIIKGVSFMPGSMFVPDRGPKPFLRLSFSSASDSDIYKGIGLLREAVHESLIRIS